MESTITKARTGMVTVCIAIAVLAGCRPPDGPQWDLTPHPVRGRVVYAGKPAAGVLVGLLPIDAPLPPAIPANPRATTKDDGSFEITTFRDGDGACVGSYQILLTWAPPAVEGEEDQTDKLLGWYDAVHSPLRIVVVAGANEIPSIDIPPRTTVPEELPGIPGRN